KPATPFGPATIATSAVAVAITTLVCTELIELSAPTPRIGRNSGQRSGESCKCAILRPDRRYQARTAVPPAENATTATPPPATPSAGNGPRPKIRHGESGTRRTTPTQLTSAGTHILPVPRTALARPFMTHSNTLPAKTTLE